MDRHPSDIGILRRWGPYLALRAAIRIQGVALASILAATVVMIKAFEGTVDIVVPYLIGGLWIVGVLIKFQIARLFYVGRRDLFSARKKVFRRWLDRLTVWELPGGFSQLKSRWLGVITLLIVTFECLMVMKRIKIWTQWTGTPGISPDLQSTFLNGMFVTLSLTAGAFAGVAAEDAYEKDMKLLKPPDAEESDRTGRLT